MSQPANTVSGTPLPFKSKLICAAVGDSLIWGQGLELEQKFCYLAAEELAQRAGKIFSPPEMRARSGARIAVPPQVERAWHYNFTRMFPEVVSGVVETKRFTAGDDRAADDLHHEIPAPFPLIPTQLKMLGAGPRPDVELLFLNGGANDIDTLKVLNPDGADMLHLHSELRHLIYYPLRKLLVDARKKCPNALIIVPSYNPMMTLTGTDDGSLHGLMEWFSAVQAPLLDAKVVALVGVLVGVYSLPAAAFYLDYKAQKELEEKADKVQRRSEIVFKLSQFWIARAVAEAREISGVRGTGIVYVNPRFDDDNSVYGSDSFVFGDYDPPKDPLVDVRMKEDPRGDFEDSLKALLQLLLMTPPLLPPPAYLVDKQKKALEHLNDLVGPRPLREALDQGDVLTNQQKREGLVGLLQFELGRLQLVRVASLLHLNAKGAKRYADRIISEVRTYQYEDSNSNFDSMVTELRGMIGDPLPTPAQALRAYGLDPNAPKGENMQLMRPDIITVVIHGVKPPPGERWAKLVLRNVEGNKQTRSVGLTMLRQPNEDATVMTGDAGGRFHLGQYKNCKVEISGWIVGQHRVEMFVNGRRVLDTMVTTFIGANLKLPYPAPVPPFEVSTPLNPAS